MDPDILKSKGVEPRNPRKGYIDGYKMEVGNMATLLRESGSKAYGLVYSLKYEETDFLFKVWFGYVCFRSCVCYLRFRRKKSSTLQ